MFVCVCVFGHQWHIYLYWNYNSVIMMKYFNVLIYLRTSYLQRVGSRSTWSCTHTTHTHTVRRSFCRYKNRYYCKFKKEACKILNYIIVKTCLVLRHAHATRPPRRRHALPRRRQAAPDLVQVYYRNNVYSWVVRWRCARPRAAGGGEPSVP